MPLRLQKGEGPAFSPTFLELNLIFIYAEISKAVVGGFLSKLERLLGRRVVLSLQFHLASDRVPSLERPGLFLAERIVERRLYSPCRFEMDHTRSNTAACSLNRWGMMI